MSDKRNQLILAALRRHGKPASSAELLDDINGLGEAEGWSPDSLAAITRQSVAKRLQAMVTTGEVIIAGKAFDGDLRRSTPTYEPAGGFDAKAPVPPPPLVEHAPSSAYEQMTRPQLVAVLEAHDDVLECVGRFFNDLRTTRDRVRSRLAAVGLNGEL